MLLKGLAQGLIVQYCGRLESGEGGIEMHSLESLHYQQQMAQTEKQAILEHKQELWK